MNQDDRSRRRRRGASAFAAAVGATLAAAMIPVAPAFAEPADDAVSAAAVGGFGCCEKLADADVFNYFDAHDGPEVAKLAVETLNADLAGLSNPGATALEELAIAIFGGGTGIPNL
jgi:hypothetical protein